MQTKQIFTAEDYRSIMEDETLDTIDLIENIFRDYRIEEWLNIKKRNKPKLHEVLELPIIVDQFSFKNSEQIPIEYKEQAFIINEDVEDGYIEQILFNTDFGELLDETVVLLYSTFKNFVVELTNELDRRDLFLPDFVFMYMAFEVLFHEYNMEEIIKGIVDEYGEELLVEKLAEEIGTSKETVVQYFTTQQQFWGY